MLITELMFEILSRPKIVMNLKKKNLNCLLNQLMKTRILPSLATPNGFAT